MLELINALINSRLRSKTVGISLRCTITKSIYHQTYYPNNLTFFVFIFFITYIFLYIYLYIYIYNKIKINFFELCYYNIIKYIILMLLLHVYL